MLKRIKNKEGIKKIFDLGNKINSSDKKVKAVYYSSYRESLPVLKYAVVISSKTGNSVWRNRFKRLIRESINAETTTIKELLLSLESDIEVIFLPAVINQINCKKIFLKGIQPAVSDILLKIKNAQSK